MKAFYEAFTVHDQKIFKLFSWDNRVRGQGSFESIYNNETCFRKNLLYLPILSFDYIRKFTIFPEFTAKS